MASRSLEKRLQLLRTLGVQSAAWHGRSLVSVTFFPPREIAAVSETATLASMEDAAMRQLEPPAIRAIRQQLDAETEPYRRQQLQDELTRRTNEWLTYSHAQ